MTIKANEPGELRPRSSPEPMPRDPDPWWKRGIWWDAYLDMASGWLMSLMIVSAVAVLVVVVATAAITVDSRNCAYAARQFHRHTHFDWLAGCYIDVGGQSVPLDRYQAFRSVR